MSQSAGWLTSMESLFLTALNTIDDRDLDSPSLLPGWTRKHVVGHVHYNAEALGRLLLWASTGVETRMYSGPDQRARDIERAATLEPASLRSYVTESSRRIVQDFEGLDGSALSRSVVTARGRTVPASEIAWMRVREAAVHAVDLNCGVTFDHLPHDLVARLAGEALISHAQSQAPQLAAWLTGRTETPPVLGDWL